MEVKRLMFVMNVVSVINMSDATYTRIGDIWKCNECNEELHGYWNLFKHDWKNHWIDRILGRDV